jgi:hypothetical protein
VIEHQIAGVLEIIDAHFPQAHIGTSLAISETARRDAISAREGSVCRFSAHVRERDVQVLGRGHRRMVVLVDELTGELRDPLLRMADHRGDSA